MMKLIDSHCHLQDERMGPRLSGILERARNFGIEKMVCCGTEEKDWEAVLRLKETCPEIIHPAFGLHPWYVKNRSSAWAGALERFLTATPSAVGETGLDHALENFDPREQKEIFRTQLELAQRHGRPVVIHCRGAWEALIGVLEEIGPLKYGGMVHSYSGSLELIPELAAFGLSFSFSGSVTYPGNKRARKALRGVPLDRLLVETDSPDILPAGGEGDNEPANLISIVKEIALLRDLPEEEIARVTFENTRKIFFDAG